MPARWKKIEIWRWKIVLKFIRKHAVMKQLFSILVNLKRRFAGFIMCLSFIRTLAMETIMSFLLHFTVLHYTASVRIHFHVFGECSYKYLHIQKTFRVVRPLKQ